MQRWEYLFVSCGLENGVWHARYRNGEEISDWQRVPAIYAYANRLGDEGWELVSLDTTSTGDGATATYRLVFKRPRE